VTEQGRANGAGHERNRERCERRECGRRGIGSWKEQPRKDDHRGSRVDVKVEELDRRADQAGKEHLARRVDGLGSGRCRGHGSQHSPRPRRGNAALRAAPQSGRDDPRVSTGRQHGAGSDTDPDDRIIASHGTRIAGAFSSRDADLADTLILTGRGFRGFHFNPRRHAR
jgi:hypothetical protein